MAGRRGSKRDFNDAFKTSGNSAPAITDPERSLQLALQGPPGLSKTQRAKLRKQQANQNRSMLALMDQPGRQPQPGPPQQQPMSAKAKAKLAKQLALQGPPQQSPKGAGKGALNSTNRIPKDEWDRLISFNNNKVCRFYNAKAGCAVRQCPRSHVCLKCGAAHPLYQCRQR